MVRIGGRLPNNKKIEIALTGTFWNWSNNVKQILQKQNRSKY